MEEERVDGNKSFKGLVRINDPRKTQWDLFIIVLAVYNCYSIPFEVAFEPAIMESAGFTVLNSIIDTLFFVDILVAFRTTYYDVHTGDEVGDKKKIGRKYLKGRFWLDLLSTIPIDNLVYAFTG
jgi:hypothetical protein